MERKLRELVSSLAPSSVWQHNYTCLCQSLVTATAGICFVVLRIVLLDKAMAMQHASPRTRLRASVTEADRAVSARSSADSVRLTMQSRFVMAAAGRYKRRHEPGAFYARSWIQPLMCSDLPIIGAVA